MVATSLLSLAGLESLLCMLALLLWRRGILCRLLLGLALREWGAREVCSHNEVLTRLCNARGESSPTLCYARHDVIQVIFKTCLHGPLAYCHTFASLLNVFHEGLTQGSNNIRRLLHYLSISTSLIYIFVFLLWQHILAGITLWWCEPKQMCQEHYFYNADLICTIWQLEPLRTCNASNRQDESIA